MGRGCKLEQDELLTQLWERGGLVKYIQMRIGDIRGFSYSLAARLDIVGTRSLDNCQKKPLPVWMVVLTN